MDYKKCETVNISLERYEELKHRNKVLEDFASEFESTIRKNKKGNGDQTISVNKDDLITFMKKHFGTQEYVKYHGSVTENYDYKIE